MSNHIIEQEAWKPRSVGPLDPDFFPEDFAKPKKKSTINRSMPRLRDLYPDELERYLELFVHLSDTRAFNAKFGYWGDNTVPYWEQEKDVMSKDWRPQTKGRPIDGKPQYVAATRDNLLPHIERHLDTDYWRARGHRAKGYRQPFWVGTLGGRYTASAAFDLDNHGGRVINFTKEGGHYRVPDLGIEILDLAQRVLSLPYGAYGLPAPTAITTSSDSLGLCVWLIPEAPLVTAALHAKMKTMVTDHGLPALEVYPIPPSREGGPYDGRSIHRRPCGHGSVTLTSTGIIRAWRDQVANFLDPVPLPTIPQLAEQLLELWLGLHQSWRPDFREVASERLDYVNQRCRVISDWVGSGCPALVLGGGGRQKDEYSKKAGKKLASVLLKGGLPEGWESLPYPDRLYYIATRGCPAEGMLNTCLIMLARHLLVFELPDLEDEEKEDVTFSVLEKWCLSRHNGCSSRLSEDDAALPKEVEDVIWRDIRSVSCCEETGVKNRNTLRVRHLITGEGPPNRFVPRVKSGGRDMDLLSVYTFAGTQIEADDYKQAEQRLVETIRSGAYDHKTIEEVEDKLAHAKPAFQQFARRLANYLLTKDNRTANIHTNLFKAMANTTSPTTMTKYKKEAIEEKIVSVVSHKYRIGGESKSYRLHPAFSTPIQ